MIAVEDTDRGVIASQFQLRRRVNQSLPDAFEQPGQHAHARGDGVPMRSASAMTSASTVRTASGTPAASSARAIVATRNPMCHSQKTDRLVSFVCHDIT